MNRLLLRVCIALCTLFLFSTSSAQTFDCYIANDHLVSSTVYEFDVYIISTSTSFSLRTVQSCFIFNPSFVDSTSNVTATVVSGSSQMVNYSTTTGIWSGSGCGFQTIANLGVSCATGTLITNLNPVRIATWRLTSSIPFNCAPANPQMVKFGDPNPSGLMLKMAISKWDRYDCSLTTTSNITANGTFTQHSPLTNYSHVQNNAPVITSQPTNASACNAGLVTFAVSASPNAGMSPAITYQWYENGNAVANGSTANGTYSGGTTPSLTITNPSVSLIGHQFYCVITQCNGITTNTVTITSSANDNNACTVDACDPVTGIVTNTPVNINDNNQCTTDACDPSSGNVSHTPVVTDDGDGCTTDGCDPVSGLYHTPVNTNDNDQCTSDACDPATGNITHNPVVIDDSSACTVDGCDPATGAFHTPVSTTDSNACTVDACDPATGNISHTPVNVDDNNACTNDNCDIANGSISHIPIDISDNDSCTFDHCNSITGVINHVPYNTDDQNLCTDDGCDALTGVYHHPISGIDDGNTCTLDVCDSANGNITHTPIVSNSPSLTGTDLCGYSTLTASGYTGSLLWNTGDTTAVINVTASGNYSVTQNISGCLSPPASVSASPLPLPNVNIGPDTLVQASNYTLSAGAGFLTYLWSDGSTGQSITVQSSGWYWVTVTNSNCSGTDSVFVDFYLAVQSPDFQNSLVVFPNPSNGRFGIQINRDLQNVHIEIADATGAIVYASENSKIAPGTLTNFELQISKGLYLLRLISDEGLFIKPVLIE